MTTNILNFYVKLMHCSYPAWQLTAHSYLAGRLINTGSCPNKVFSQHFCSETFLKNPFHTLLIFLTINFDHQRKWVNGTKHTQTQTLFCSIELISILFKFHGSWLHNIEIWKPNNNKGCSNEMAKFVIILRYFSILVSIPTKFPSFYIIYLFFWKWFLVPKKIRPFISFLCNPLNV